MKQNYLFTPIDYLKGVGPNRADLLKSELKIFTYEDLLNSDSKYHQQVITNALDENDMESITDELLIDGIRLFEEAFDSLLGEIKNKITDRL